MARRTLKPRHTEEIRAKIQASQLVNRLTNHALGKAKMSATQVRAAEILLRKSVPDLHQVSGAGDDGEHVVRHEGAVSLIPFEQIRKKAEGAK